MYRLGRKAAFERAYDRAEKISCDACARLVFMSDAHRGCGNWNDNFMDNQQLCFTALQYYYERGYSYFELGDGDELWENRSQKKIIEQYSHIFWILSKFYRENRLYMLYGNHDRKKSREEFLRKNFTEYYNECSRHMEPLFPDIKVYEAIRLEVEPGEIFLMHGHQGDLFNDYLHGLTGWLVRYLWTPLEEFGVHDPTRAAGNYRKCDKITKSMETFCRKKNMLMISGHTHRPRCPLPGEGCYFNDGSMVHPRCITALEISAGKVSLVKWAVCTRRDGTLYVCREMLEGPYELKEYFR